MKVRLGVAGLPTDIVSLAAISEALDVSLVFILDGQPEASDLPPGAEAVFIDADDGFDVLPVLKPLELAGVWVANGRYRRQIGRVAEHLDWPRLPCCFGIPDGALPIPGARIFTMDDFARVLEDGSDEILLPAWVRASCGDGDTSCMRVEHPSDLSLALEKLRKRNPDGVLRIQPAVKGAVYRLMAFKTGRDLVPFDVLEETVTTSVYRVPLGMAMPLPADGRLMDEMVSKAQEVNAVLPSGWGYVEMEFVASEREVILTDVQAPARLGEDLRTVVRLSRGVDLRLASMECSLGRHPSLSPTRNTGVAFTWLLTRSGVVTGLEHVDSARTMPGVVEVHINARPGDILSHVVDLPSRERGGFIVTEGDTAAIAMERLAAAREKVWITTSPALS